MRVAIFAITVIIFTAGCSPNEKSAESVAGEPPERFADTVYTNGRIYTVNES